MAVTIDEMRVEVQQPAPSANAPTTNAEPNKDVDLSQAIEMLRERKLRLLAD
jgi:hypothetical protein